MSDGSFMAFIGLLIFLPGLLYILKSCVSRVLSSGINRGHNHRSASVHNVQDERVRVIHSRKTVVLTILFFLFMAGYFVEYIRQYQVEVAKIHALVVNGPPPECSPHTMGVLEKIKSWLAYHLSWKHAPCEDYHEALMVWPSLQVNPLLVLTSLCARVISSPLSVLTTALGENLSRFFRHIPLQWQPVFVIFAGILMFSSCIMICRYRISVPFLTIEPFGHGDKSDKQATKTLLVSRKTVSERMRANVVRPRGCVMCDVSRQAIKSR